MKIDKLAMERYGLNIIQPENGVLTDDFFTDFVSQIAQKKSEILDDFMLTYVIARLEYFKKYPSKLKRLELVEQRKQDGSGSTFYFRLRGGRLPKVLQPK